MSYFPSTHAPPFRRSIAIHMLQWLNGTHMVLFPRERPADVPECRSEPMQLWILLEGSMNHTLLCSIEQTYNLFLARFATVKHEFETNSYEKNILIKARCFDIWLEVSSYIHQTFKTYKQSLLAFIRDLPGKTSRYSWFGTWIQPFLCWIIHWNIFSLLFHFTCCR